MGVIDIFRSKPWSLEPLEQPWAPLRSLYEDIAAHLDTTSGALPANYRLPDEHVTKHAPMRVAVPLKDAVVPPEAIDERAEVRTRELVEAVEMLLCASTSDNLRRLYEVVTREGILSIIDDVIVALVAQRDVLDAARYHALARHLAYKAGHREAVKLGISMLGLLDTPEDEGLLMTLGACDEFTLFVAVALSNQVPDEAAVHRHLLALAQRTHGWGRVHVVDRLAETTDSVVRAWLLREGFRNTVAYEHLACTCARVGELSKALANPDIDDALLVSAAEIFAALVRGQAGPSEGMDDYEEASRAVASYLGQITVRRPQDLHHLITADALREYLEQEDDWEARRAHGWTEPHRQRCLRMATEVLAWPEWRELALRAQSSDDKLFAWQGDLAAKILRIVPHGNSLSARSDSGDE
jgi:hypothetical protein